MRKASDKKEVEARHTEIPPCWQESLAAALGGYYPPYTPMEDLIRHVRGAE